MTAETVVHDPIQRLDDQIAWYTRHTATNRLGHWVFRVASLTMAAAVPATAVGLGGDAKVVVPAALGAAVVVAQGVDELFRFQENWTAFGATAEALKREKSLYEAHAGPYDDGTGNAETKRLNKLAERVEATISSETSQWVEMQKQARPDVAEPSTLTRSGGGKRP